MRQILISLAIVLTLAVVGNAQDKFVAAGMTVSGSEGVGSNYSVGIFSEGNYVWKRFEGNGIASISREPKSGVDGNWAFRLRPELRFSPKSYGWFDPFVGGGINYVRLSNSDWNKAGLNYVGSVGTHLFNRAGTVRISRLFTDRTNLNINRLEGWRYGFDINAVKRVRASFEYEPFTYFQPTIGRVDSWSLTFRTGYIF